MTPWWPTQTLEGDSVGNADLGLSLYPTMEAHGWDEAQQPGQPSACLWEGLWDDSLVMAGFYSYFFLIRGKNVVSLFFSSPFDPGPSPPHHRAPILRTL